MKLAINAVIRAEIIHHFDNLTRITSTCNRLTIENGGLSGTVILPLMNYKRIASIFRLTRRVLRTDKGIFYPLYIGAKLEAVVGVYQGTFYRIEWPTLTIRKTAKFRQGRAPLHQSICETDAGNLFLGEYSPNRMNCPVPVWKSNDRGNSWEIVFEFDRNKARHIHGCFWDPFEKKVWVCTGDFEGECNIVCADEEFKHVEWLSDGTQSWRTCHLIFRREHVIFGMDSPLSQSYINRFDRGTRRLERIFKVPGPIWYAKDLTDGWMLFASAIEGGASEQGDYARIFASQDGSKWHEVYKARKDRWPMVFKAGVIAFSSGSQDSSHFYCFGEALNSMDGKIFQSSIEHTEDSNILQQCKWILDNQAKVVINFPLPDPTIFQAAPGVARLQSKTQYFGATAPNAEAALNNLTMAVLDLLQQGCLELETPEWVRVWADKLLRGCELNRLELQHRLANEHESKQYLRIKALRLCLFFLNMFAISDDARYVNIVLKIIDMDWLAFKKPLERKTKLVAREMYLEALVSLYIDVALDLIKSPTWQPKIVHPNEARLIDTIELPMRAVFPDSPEVVVFSPNPYGLLTLCASELLKIHGVKVKGIVVRRLFNFHRLVKELERDGFGWVFKKIKNKLLFRKSNYHDLAFQTLPQLCTQLGLLYDSVSAWCRANASDMIVCNEFNDANVHKYLESNRPELVIFCGGGLISEKTVRLCGAGVLNCHGGLLPRYRGLDNVEWALLERHCDLVGMTTHFMSKYVDEGDILLMRKIDISCINNLDEAIKCMEVDHVKLLAYTAVKYLEKKVAPYAQRKEDGKQYFYMHSKLVAIARENAFPTGSV